MAEATFGAVATTRVVGAGGVLLVLLGWIGGHISDPATRSGAMFLVGLIVVMATIGFATVDAARDRRPQFSTIRAALAPILESERTITWFAVGALIGVPILRFHGNVIGDADSARLLANVLYLRSHGLGYLTETQEVLVPHAAYWLTSVVGGLGVARWVPLFSYLVLSGTVAALAWRVTRHPLAPLVASVGLYGFVPLLDQQKRLPLYALMLAASTAGAFVAARLDGGWRSAGAAAALLVIGAESHATGQLFLSAPALLLVLPPWPARWRATLRTYGVVAVLMVPRLLVNLAEHGTSRLRSNYDYYLIRNGYLDLINRDFWGYPVDVPLREYVSTFTDMVRVEFRWYALAIVALALIGVVRAPARVRIVAILSTLVVIGGILQVRPSPFPRYILPLAPGVAVLGAWAAVRLWHLRRAMAVIACIAVGASGAWSLVQAQRLVQASDERIRTGAWPDIASAINDDRAVAGVRAPQIMYVRDDVEVYGPLIWSEAEYVRYLTWESDDDVLALLDEYDVGWVFLTGDGQRIDGETRTYEEDYPGAWVEPTYGIRPRQREMIAQSPAFCLRAEQGNFQLYEVGPC
jgi:hypothetical protein